MTRGCDHHQTNGRIEVEVSLERRGWTRGPASGKWQVIELGHRMAVASDSDSDSFTVPRPVVSLSIVTICCSEIIV